MLSEAGYVHSQGDLAWWIPEGQIFYSPNLLDSPAQEHAYASQHFFQPCRYTDPFGSTTFVRYDAYDLLVLETEDPLTIKSPLVSVQQMAPSRPAWITASCSRPC